MFAPLRIFFSLGSVSIVVGAAYGIVTLLLRSNGVPPAAVLVILSGVILVALGLIADQISQMRLSEYESTSISRLNKNHEEV